MKIDPSNPIFFDDSIEDPYSSIVRMLSSF